MSTTTNLVEILEKNIQAKLDRGETSVAKELRELHDLKALLEKDKPSESIREGEPVRVKRSYTMTEAARAQRQAAAAMSTGPTTLAGKAASSKNAWKHGKFAQSRILGLGKPCKSTCPDFPCSLVEEGRCTPGADCLDKEHLIEACLAIERALKEQDFGNFHDLMVMELGETLQVVRELRASILEHGAVMESAHFDKEGKVIGYELKPHPSLLALPNLMKNLGISFTDFMMTPAAVERKKSGQEAAETLADILSGINRKVKQAEDAGR
jgi:hypothetical protein